MSRKSSTSSSNRGKNTRANQERKISANNLINIFLKTISTTLKTEAARTNALLSGVLLIALVITVVPSAFYLISNLLTIIFNFVITLVDATRQLLPVPEIMQDRTPFIMFEILAGQVVFCVIIVSVWAKNPPQK